jgi:hypothetical protein
LLIIWRSFLQAILALAAKVTGTHRFKKPGLAPMLKICKS